MDGGAAFARRIVSDTGRQVKQRFGLSQPGVVRVLCPCVWETFWAGLAGLLIVAAGAGMVVTGYYAGYTNYVSTNSTNHTMATPSPVTYLMHMGAAVIGVGAFIIIIAAVVFLETKVKMNRELSRNNADIKSLRPDLYDLIISNMKESLSSGASGAKIYAFEVDGESDISSTRTGNLLASGRFYRSSLLSVGACYQSSLSLDDGITRQQSTLTLPNQLTRSSTAPNLTSKVLESTLAGAQRILTVPVIVTAADVPDSSETLASNPQRTGVSLTFSDKESCTSTPVSC